MPDYEEAARIEGWTKVGSKIVNQNRPGEVYYNWVQVWPSLKKENRRPYSVDSFAAFHAEGKEVESDPVYGNGLETVERLVDAVPKKRGRPKLNAE